MAVGPSAPPMMPIEPLCSGENPIGIGAEERHEDADLRRSAQQETLGIGDQRTEIGHGAYAPERSGRGRCPA